MWWTKSKLSAAVAAAVVLVGGVAYPALSGGPTRPADGPKPAADARPADAPADLRDTLVRLEKLGWEWLKGADRKAAPDALADDYVAVLNDGRRLTRDELLKELAEVRLNEYSMSDVKLTPLAADAAVLTYRATTAYTYKGEAEKETLWVSSSWARRNGRWVNVHYHETTAAK